MLVLCAAGEQIASTRQYQQFETLVVIVDSEIDVAKKRPIN